MSLQDQDFIIRQVQQLAKGLGRFMGLEGIKDILQFEQTEDGELTDDQIETIVLITHIEEIQTNKDLSIHALSQEIRIKPEDINALYANERFATESELEKMRLYVEENTEYLE